MERKFEMKLRMEGLSQLNSRLSSWVAGISWWRLLALFIILMIAANITADLLHLRHDREPVPQAHRGQGVKVTIGGKKTITIDESGTAVTSRPPASEADAAAPRADAAGMSGAASASAASASATAASAPSAAGASPAGAPGPTAQTPDEEEAREIVIESGKTRQVFTLRGLIGDLGAVALTLLFAYLVAAKIIVRKTAESDARVRQAEDVAGRETVQRQLVQARLKLMQAQVEPHFLFNTLAAVDYLIETDPPRASQMQKTLITYLRSALPQMREESSTLGREMRLIRAYLELMKMRIEDRLDFDIQMPASLEQAVFPPMMLQSLVENAIRHGIEPRTEGGKVTVLAKLRGEQLVVEVRDTGVGIDDDDILDGVEGAGGLGLRNIRERLAVLYPGRSRLALSSDGESGASVRISIPLQMDSAPVPQGQAA